MAEREAYWRDILRRQRESGESIAEFCHHEGVSTASFYNWRKRLRAPRTARPQLLPLHVAAPRACLEIILPCGTLLRVPDGTAPQTLRDVLVALEPPAC